MNVVEWVKVEDDAVPQEEHIEEEFTLVSDITNAAKLRTVLYYYPSFEVLVKKLSNATGQVWWYQVFLSDVKE